MTIYYTQYIYHYMRHDAFVLKLEIVPFFGSRPALYLLHRKSQ